MLRKILFASILVLGAPTAMAATCSVEVEGNDMMQFSVKDIAVSKGCKDFTIKLRHTGKLARNVMGHNLVVAKSADIKGIDADGIKAGLDADYVKAGDTRVVAHTDVIGGGQGTSVTFPVSKLAGSGPYAFFCSFPGHSSIMKGTITLTP